MSRAVSRAEAAFALTTGRGFSPFLITLIVFFSDIALFRVSFESESIQRISRHTVPKISKTRTLDGDYACKEEATSANARDKIKKGHFPQKNFSAWRIRCSDARKPYTNPVTLLRQLLRFPYERRVFGFHVEFPDDFVGAVNHEDEADCPTDIHVFQPVDHL